MDRKGAAFTMDAATGALLFFTIIVYAVYLLGKTEVGSLGETRMMRSGYDTLLVMDRMGYTVSRNRTLIESKIVAYTPPNYNMELKVTEDRYINGTAYTTFQDTYGNVSGKGNLVSGSVPSYHNGAYYTYSFKIEQK
ncbi:MAG: hypothetical protein NTU61_03665 [Candidatus Altiarchaeota archaeon]|nr:hypothetical protein [Candidatus Altiarchaeota archaeon]